MALVCLLWVSSWTASLWAEFLYIIVPSILILLLSRSRQVAIAMYQFRIAMQTGWNVWKVRFLCAWLSPQSLNDPLPTLRQKAVEASGMPNTLDRQLGLHLPLFAGFFRFGDIWIIALCWVGLMRIRRTTDGGRIKGIVGQAMRLIDGTESLQPRDKRDDADDVI